MSAAGAGFLAGNAGDPGDDSAEAGFARDMATHHAQAVEMSMLAVQRSGREDLRTLALDMGLTQQAQIGMMRAWLDTWNLSPTSTAAPMAWMNDDTGMNHEDMTAEPAPDGDRAAMPGMATPQELDALRQQQGAAFDSSFVDLMVRHHNGGIQMVDAVLARGPDPLVRDLATSMKRGQQSEITALEQIKADLVETP
ncbi:DUF305 domain-containing protein [Actinoplanes sp. NEAU-H7]|uniref:DUF305 domain-containing protein n=2 Tax=Actinoplanes flavus TaxID=2820290 RepID=A0ABS3UDP6_9ACTN|nr:DUF305 domain-containing protein [Actinoplanes flavus]